MRVGAIQSNYIPWRGYFDFIDSVDAFVLLDDVQYTRRDWRNRNRIKTSLGSRWITIPVAVKGKYTQLISETQTLDTDWVAEHLLSLRHAYARAPFFEREWPWIERAYSACERTTSLSEINEILIRAICERLNIKTTLRRSREFTLPDERGERLIQLCRALDADEYVSGPAASSYIVESEWASRGIRVRYKRYDYPEYPQLFPPFDPHVTVLDLILNAGPESRSLMKSDTTFAER
jgi:hypothetical protein